MLKRLFITIIAIVSLISTARAAETDWSVHIKVSVPDQSGADGTVWNHLIAGVREGATGGFDRAWDTLALSEADDPVQSMFVHGASPEDTNSDGVIDRWTCNNPEAGYTDYECGLWGDVRGFRAEEAWSFPVVASVNGATVTLQWAFDGKPDNIEIVLIDLTNPANRIDMKNNSRYPYTNSIEAGKKYGVRYFEIRMKALGLFIVPPALPDATAGTSYHESLSAIGGTPVWSLAGGELPPGISINPSTGEISGTPLTPGLYQFVVQGDDPASGYSRSMEYALNVNEPPRIETSALPDGLVGTDYSARITAAGGSAPVSWTIRGNLPEGVLLNTGTGTLSGRLIVPGIYDFTVTIRDGNGSTDSKDFRITVTEPEDRRPPDAIQNLRGMNITDTSALLMWTAPADDSLTRTAALYDLRYIEDCPDTVGLDDGTWDSATEVSGEPRPQAGVLQTFTLSGLDRDKTYCIAIKSLDASGNVSAISNRLPFPLTAGSSDAAISGLLELSSPILLREGYNLISLPLIPLESGREGLFSLMVGSPVALYRWYSAYPGITPPDYYLEDIVQPGLGYFLYSPADNMNLIVDGLKIEDMEFSVMLQNGWNMIGPPYDGEILLRDVLVKRNATGEKGSYTEAVKAGWIGNSIYRLKDGNYDFASFNDDPPAVLEPWVGYWVYVNDADGVEIIFRRP